jgi:hypothetical protein
MPPDMDVKATASNDGDDMMGASATSEKEALTTRPVLPTSDTLGGAHN